ncbi:MAG: efflux RND transporter periplasmic adaptor subunit [Rhodoferax sp.]|nr:efflux RND transporter periplasmic adaptor subunit [Rhodoferax sp.]
MNKTRWLVLPGLLVVAAAAAWWWTQRAGADTVQYRTATIERGNLQATVSASGAVNPVTQVSVGTQVSGQIRDLLVDFNSEVKAGQLIAQIDPETFEYRVRSAQADVEAAQAAVATAQASAAAGRAQVARAQVDLNEAQRDFERKHSLVQMQFIAQSESDRARALVNTTAEALKATQAQVGVTEAQIRTAMANVAQREAALAQARVDLARTRITSPVDGIVIKRAIEKGQTVAASLQSPELFVIAQNLSDMQVDASVDESDVGRIRAGQHATFTVDAFPGQTFEGEVRQVRKAAQTIANVVTYVAVVGFSNGAGRLLPGMTANVRIVTDQRDNVLKVPNAALRVRIAGVEPAPAAGASAPAGAGSGTSTGDAAGWSWMAAAHAQPAAGGFAAMRERLIADLQLDASQQARLDAIMLELRPRFMALADLEQAQRQPARARLLAEMQQKINAMLTPDQRATYEQMQARAAASRAAQATSAGAAGAAPAGDTANCPPAASAAAAARGGAPRRRTPAPQPGAAVAPGPARKAAAASPPTGGGIAAPVPVAPAAAGGGPLQEWRNRLVAELRLGAEQAARIDAVIAEARPRFMALRDLPADERPKGRDRIMADLRARIGDVLTPEQKTRYAAMQAEAAGRANTRGRIYLLGADGKPKAFNVRLGISDGSSTELLLTAGGPAAAELREGATVITGVLASASGGGSRPPGGPRLPF